MNCPQCGRQTGEVHEQHMDPENSSRTVMTIQQVCQCGWRGDQVPLTAEERAAIDHEASQSMAALNVRRTTVKLKDLPAATRRKVKEQLENA